MKILKKHCELCCNYVDGECLILNHECVQEISLTPICNYFKKAILPLFHVEQGSKKCSCGAYFVPKCNRQRYCKDCSNQVTWNRNYRRKQSQ